MNSIKPSTISEKTLFKAIQKIVGSSEDGILGTQTMCDIAVKLKAKCFPITLSMYNYPIIIGNDLIAFNPNGSLSGYKNSMLGSFTYPRATTPCSILINNSKVICGNSCHAHISKPETVIYKTANGKIDWVRTTSYTGLPKDTVWAVGGMGLCDMYNPDAEGFSGSYADVLRKTNHNVLGVKDGMVYGVYYKNLTGQQINSHCKNTMKFDMAILLDGGGLAAINGSESFAKINTSIKQGYAIQFI
jgi:hypothetical protein